MKTFKKVYLIALSLLIIADIYFIIMDVHSDLAFICLWSTGTAIMIIFIYKALQWIDKI